MECVHGNSTKEPCRKCNAANRDVGHSDNFPPGHIIDRHDLPVGTFIDTRHGMKLAYGTLWKTWIDKVGDKNKGTALESVAASMAREILRAQLSQKECGEGISLFMGSSELRRAVMELCDEAKKHGMHDNAMSTETADVVSSCYDFLEG